MKSHTTAAFRTQYKNLPPHIKNQALKNYLLWKVNSSYPSLHFKCISEKSNTWSVRIGIGYRALGVIQDDAIIWFWIGSHERYNRLVQQG